MTDTCDVARATARDAGSGTSTKTFNRGAPPPDQVIAHTNLYWRYETAPGRVAGVTETKDVAFRG